MLIFDFKRCKDEQENLIKLLLLTLNISACFVYLSGKFYFNDFNEKCCCLKLLHTLKVKLSTLVRILDRSRLISAEKINVLSICIIKPLLDTSYVHYCVLLDRRKTLLARGLFQVWSDWGAFHCAPQRKHSGEQPAPRVQLWHHHQRDQGLHLQVRLCWQHSLRSHAHRHQDMATFCFTFVS